MWSRPFVYVRAAFLKGTLVQFFDFVFPASGARNVKKGGATTSLKKLRQGRSGGSFSGLNPDLI